MKELPPSAPEPLARPPKRNSSSQPPPANPARARGAPVDDLAKNQWIPFASTAVFFLVTAVIVSWVGGLAIRLAEPVVTPFLSPTMPASPTAPPLPTATGMPSPTIAVPTPSPIILRVLPSTANVRAAPSATAKVINQIKKDTLAIPLARSVDGRWFLIVSVDNTLTGWVANELFEIISGDPKTIPTIVPVAPTPQSGAGGRANPTRA